jgi:sugar (pentulose or hexulose) kinase
VRLLDKLDCCCLPSCQVKRQFAAQTPDDETFTIPVGGVTNSTHLGVHRGRFAVKASEIRAIFKPIIHNILKLVKDQLQAVKVPVTAILLVGGFGASTYLRDSITGAVKKTVRVLQPPNAWQAVVQGAVLKGLANNDPTMGPLAVRARKARRSYGVILNTPYNSERHAHLEHLKHWDPASGCHRVPVMHWFIKRVSSVKYPKSFLAAR